MGLIKGDDQNYYELVVEKKHETENAILVSDGGKEAWIPISLIEDITDNGSSFDLMIPEWLAVEKGLV